MVEMDKFLESLPDEPGVYMFKNSKGCIIYVGKAVSLKKRVRSYFSSTQKSPRIEVMLKKIAEVDYIVTDSEIEALILESNLIKKHRPRYNVLMKDDKNYPYIKITMNERFPRLVVVRRIKKDESKYFGPYVNAGAMRETLKLIRKVFPIRSCKKDLTGTPIKDRECLNYHIKRCLAPCQVKVSEKKYNELINDVILFLRGRGEELIRRLRKEMEKAARDMNFERAAEIRDKIRAIKQVVQKQKVVSSSMEDQDVIAVEKDNNEALVQIFFIRKGKLVESDSFILAGTSGLNRKEILTSFVKQFYSGITFIPREVLVGEEVEDRELIEQWLSEKKGSRVYLKTPQRGEKKRLVEMVYQNAVLNMKQRKNTIKKKQQQCDEALAELARYLNLDEPPYRIEAFDISNIQGVQSVASMVVFEEGQPKKSDYRKFKVKTVNGPDDFASMYEVIYRRFAHSQKEIEQIKKQETSRIEGKFCILPDLILVDGGKGQLNSARKALKELGLEDIPAIGLAKEFEHVFVEDRKDPVILPPNSQGLYLLQRIRDEAHRFAITYHRKLRNKKALTSVLDEIPGIGPKRRNALLKELGSLESIKQASINELIQVKGMNKKVAESVYGYFRKKRSQE